MCDYTITYDELNLSQKKKLCLYLCTIALVYVEKYGSINIINDYKQYLQMIIKEETNNLGIAAKNRLLIFSNECGEMEEYSLHYLATEVLERYMVYKSISILMGYNLFNLKCYGFVDLIDIANVLDEYIFCHINKFELTFEQLMGLIKSHDVKDYTLQFFKALVNSINEDEKSKNIIEEYKKYIQSVLGQKII